MLKTQTHSSYDSINQYLFITPVNPDAPLRISIEFKQISLADHHGMST